MLRCIQPNMDYTEDYTLFRQRNNRDRTANQTLDWSTYTFLVVEDTQSNFSLIQKYLYKTGVCLLHAENGLQAIQKVKDNPDIDIVLMDIKLPEFNGLKATAAIKHLKPSLTVIAQTAFAMDSDRDLCLNVGCDDFIAKPYRKHELLELIARFL